LRKQAADYDTDIQTGTWPQKGSCVNIQLPASLIRRYMPAFLPSSGWCALGLERRQPDTSSAQFDAFVARCRKELRALDQSGDSGWNRQHVFLAFVQKKSARGLSAGSCANHTHYL